MDKDDEVNEHLAQALNSLELAEEIIRTGQWAIEKKLRQTIKEIRDMQITQAAGRGAY